MKCLALILYPKPKINQIHRYYKTFFSYSAGNKNEKLIRKRSEIILKELIHHVSNRNSFSLLDIGSGYGFFLDEAKKKYPKISAMGIEPNKNLFVFSIQHFHTTVKNVDFSTFFRIYRKKYTFDVITIIHTLEHIYNPKEMITQAVSLLNPNGILYIETPNFDSHLYRAEKNNYTFLTPPDHLYIFSQKTFKILLFKNCYLYKTSTYSYPEHFMGIVKKLIQSKSINPSSLKSTQKNSLHKINVRKRIISRIKYALFDRFFAPILCPLLNLHCQGSILELYIKKK